MAVPVISFIGWSGVGKTTFLENLITALKARGLSVAVLKHDGHEFQMDVEGKDTWKLTRAGADVVAIANARHAAILENRPIGFAELLNRVGDVDMVIAEGFENEAVPQIEVHRAGFGALRCRRPERLIAVISDEAVETAAPVFGFANVQAVADICISYTRKENS